MPKAINVPPGQRYGRLTVIREGDRKFFSSRPKGARTFWCRCDCGNETNVLLSSLTGGGTASCGCQLIAKPVDVKPGDRFGRLTIVRELPRRITPSQPGGVRVFECRCDCGEIRAIVLTSLRQGRTVSCGCLNREKAKSPENLARLAGYTSSPEHRTRSAERGRSPETLARLAAWRESPEFAAWVRSPENLARLQSPEHLEMLASGLTPEIIARRDEDLRIRATTHGLRGHKLYDTHKDMMARCYNSRSKGYKNYGGRGVAVCPEWHDVGNFIAWIEANIGPRPEDVTESGHPAYSLDRINGNRDYEPGNVRWADWVTQRANQRQPYRG